MKNFLKWGLIIVIINVVLGLVGLAISNPAEAIETGEVGGASQLIYWATILISIVCLFLGIKQKRDEDSGDFTFGRGWVEGTLISLIGAAFSAIWTYIFFAMISPEFLDMIRDKAIMDMQQQQMSAEQLEQATSMMDMMFSPTSMAIWTLIMFAVGGMIISLIFSAIVNSTNKNAGTPATA